MQAAHQAGGHSTGHQTAQVGQAVSPAGTPVELLGAERDEPVPVHHQTPFAHLSHGSSDPLAPVGDGCRPIEAGRPPVAVVAPWEPSSLTSAGAAGPCSQGRHNGDSVPPMPPVVCRFDDLRAGVAVVAHDLVDEVVADRPDQVPAVLDTVDAAVAAGHPAAGMVAYEGGFGLGDRVLVAPPSPHGEVGPPLAWFGIFRRLEAAAPVVSVHRGHGGHGPGDRGLGDRGLGDRGLGAGMDEHGEPGGGAVGPPASLVGSLAHRRADSGPWEASDDHWHWEMSRAEHRAAVDGIRTRIGVGDVYQVNLTQRLERPSSSLGSDQVLALYRALARAQRGRSHALLHGPDWTVLSASPEELFALDGTVVRCRPMKGTARRRHPIGGSQDRRMAEELVASAKERAENVMIVDLMRNDLGRVACPGSIAVPELCRLEAYPTVWQLTSTVTGTVPAGTGIGPLLGALFPSGSVTGAPKLAAMAVIAEVERSARGVYCGTIGWVTPSPSGVRARFSVAIRTLVADHRRGVAHYGVGGGITWSSRADAEWRELEAKAAILRGLPWGRTPACDAPFVR